MKKICGFAFLSLFCAIVLFFSIAIFVLPRQDFSRKENRPLASVPRLSVSALLEGDFFDQLHDFYADHIPLRDSLCSLYAVSELSLGKMQTNRVIPSTNGALVALPEHNTPEGTSLDEIYALEEADTRLCFYAVPRSADVFALPSLYDDEQIKSVSSALRGASKASFDRLIATARTENDFYYKTDHHWTTDGAYFAYTEICQRLGIAPASSDFFIKERICSDFFGTSFSKSGLPYSLCSPDTIELYRYSGDTDFLIYNNETKQSLNGFYDLGALDGSDKYSVFMGGNYASLSISLPSAERRPRLLLIKDSYANSLIPFLAIHFDIEVLDGRYCTRSDIVQACSNQQFDKLLILAGIETLFAS